MELKVKKIFDKRYRLTRILGSGGFSEVWLAEDTKVSNQKKALKVYAPGKGLDAGGVQLFSKEFELVFDLNHANLLRPAHFDVCDHSPYLVLPYSCKDAGLPRPELNEKKGGFIVTIFKDKFSEEKLRKIGLNTRQIKAALYVKEKGRITNKAYQEINNVSKRTATNDLSELVVTYKIFKQLGVSIGTYYEIE